MDLILIDLEWNGSPLYKTGGYFNEIIEIGAVKLNSDLQTISTFQTLVRPTVHKKLTGRVKRLTHITNDEVRSAVAFPKTFAGFAHWVGEGDNCFMSWGTGDLLVMIENLEHYRMPSLLSVMHNYCDAQELCQRKLGIERAKQPGLSAVAEQLGIPCENMDMHRALDDSIITACCVKQVWDSELFGQICRPANEEFLRRLLFKPYFICDTRNPAIKPEMLETVCQQCGTPMIAQGKPWPRGRQVNITYYCPHCDKSILGRHQFRMRFDGIEHKLTWREIPLPEEAAEEETAEEAAAATPEANSVGTEQ